MIVPVSDFSRITKVSRNTVYSWIYRNNMPEGVSLANVGKTKILKVKKESEYFSVLAEDQFINDFTEAEEEAE